MPDFIGIDSQRRLWRFDSSSTDSSERTMLATLDLRPPNPQPGQSHEHPQGLAYYNEEVYVLTRASRTNYMTGNLWSFSIHNFTIRTHRQSIEYNSTGGNTSIGNMTPLPGYNAGRFAFKNREFTPTGYSRIAPDGDSRETIVGDAGFERVDPFGSYNMQLFELICWQKTSGLDDAYGEFALDDGTVIGGVEQGLWYSVRGDESSIYTISSRDSVDHETNPFTRYQDARGSTNRGSPLGLFYLEEDDQIPHVVFWNTSTNVNRLYSCDPSAAQTVVREIAALDNIPGEGQPTFVTFAEYYPPIIQQFLDVVPLNMNMELSRPDLAVTGGTSFPVNPYVHWALTVEDLGVPETDRHWWSGEGDITIDGTTYKGATVDGQVLIGISPLEHSVDQPNKRMRIQVAIDKGSLRDILAEDVGIVGVRVRWIVSGDAGQSWYDLGRSFFGRLSAPVISGGVYSMELETYLGDADKGSPLQWSDETQQVQYPGDRGFEYVRGLADGFEHKWPP